MKIFVLKFNYKLTSFVLHARKKNNKLLFEFYKKKKTRKTWSSRLFLDILWAYLLYFLFLQKWKTQRGETDQDYSLLANKDMFT